MYHYHVICEAAAPLLGEPGGGTGTGCGLEGGEGGSGGEGGGEGGGGGGGLILP